MARMKAAMAAVLVMEKEGVEPGLRRARRGHQPAVRGAARARVDRPRAGAPRRGRLAHGRGLHARQGRQHRRVHRHLRPGRHRHDHRACTRRAPTRIPILCITGQAPRARLHKEDFQAVDIESIVKPVTKWSVTVREPAQVPRAFQQAFHLMRSGRPGPVLIDLPFDVQMAEIEFDIDTYEPLPVYKPAATRKQVEKAIDMLQAAERPLIVAGGGIINADASALLVEFAETDRRAGDPDADGLGHASPTTTR